MTIVENRGEGEGKRGHSGLLARQGMLLLFGDTGGGNKLYIYIHTRVGYRFVFIAQVVVSLQLSQSLLRSDLSSKRGG